jgi:hypothetical protein
MKSLIIGVGTLLLSIFVYLSVSDIKQLERNSSNLRYACEELSATGALYNDKTEYGNGRLVFNRTESIKAIEDQLKTLLNTDALFVPLSNSYWTDKIQYKVYFYDDIDLASGPKLFVDPDTGFTQTITKPTVIVTVNAGKGRFHFPAIATTYKGIRTAAHEWGAYN